MKIAVTTPSGHVGSAVADFLLQRGGDISVRLLGRRPNMLEAFIQRGADVAVGSQDDADYLLRATRDVDALFWVTPPGFGSDNVRAFQNRLGHAAAYAIRTNRIPRVVNFSSIGAGLDSGVGLINGLHDVEELLNEAGGNITHLRPGFFFENLLYQRDSIKNAGRISLPLSGSRRFGMIATRDIARVAADRLSDRKWTGHQVCELHGPADMSFDEVAEVLSQALGRKVEFVRCDLQQQRQTILSSGMSENVAELMIEMYEAAESGRLQPSQGRSPQTTTPTTLSQFARAVMLPMVTEHAPQSH
jgi:uncharacterized protein YbjT (DUF2867 family)